MPAIATSTEVDAVRRFNRFYTRQVGALQEGLLQSPFSLAEARVLYEIAQREEITAAELSALLRMDAGYLSRLLRRLRDRRLVAVQPSRSDARRGLIRLTKSGRQAFTKLNASSHEEVKAELARLSAPARGRLVTAMRTVEELLGDQARTAKNGSYVLRPPKPGDMGWVVQRHGALYALEYAWDERFEALVARIVAEFVEQHDPKRERCWIAEADGKPVGSVFLVKRNEETAKLRLLLVEPDTRGMGIGARLVDECVRFARSAGYRKMTLWTNSVLKAARHIYVKAGFKRVKSERHHSFGRSLVGETWELRLV